MSDATPDISTTGDGSHLPLSFKKKLHDLALVVVFTVVVSVSLSAFLFWLMRGPLEQRVLIQEQALQDKDQEFRKRITDSENLNSELLKSRDQLKEKVSSLEANKNELTQLLKGTMVNLETAQTSVQEINESLSKYVRIELQDTVDARQNSLISENSNRIGYVERGLKSLEGVEADVLAIKNDTGNLKGQYFQLKNDLNVVKDKGEITQKELTTLSERSRLFQLHVLAARARQAAEAARKGDLKKLLERLGDEE